MAQRTGHATIREQYRTIHRKIRQIVEQRKRQQYQAYLDAIEEKGPAEARTQLAKMARMKQRRQATNSSNGAALPLGHFTAHVARVCRDISGWRPTLAAFQPPEYMAAQVRLALARAPTGKAPGQDGVKAEMLLCQMDLSSELLMERAAGADNYPGHGDKPY